MQKTDRHQTKASLSVPAYEGRGHNKATQPRQLCLVKRPRKEVCFQVTLEGGYCSSRVSNEGWKRVPDTCPSTCCIPHVSVLCGCVYAGWLHTTDVLCLSWSRAGSRGADRSRLWCQCFSISMMSFHHLAHTHTIHKHVSSVSAICFYHLCQLRRIWRSLDADSA